MASSGPAAIATMRAGDHPGYGRLVLDVPPAARADVERHGDSVTLHLSGAALAAALPPPPHNIRSLRRTADGILVSVAPGARLHQYRLYGRVVFDAFDPTEVPSSADAPPSPSAPVQLAQATPLDAPVSDIQPTPPPPRLLPLPAPFPASHARPPAARATAARGGALEIDAGSGRLLELSTPVENVFVADPKVAEVRPASATTLFVFGLAPGRTSIAALDKAGHPVGQYDVTIRPSGYGASEAQRAIAWALPGRDIQVHAEQHGLQLTGTVNSPADADTALTLAGRFAPDGAVQNNLTVLSSTQVNLRVRIAEMSRTVTRALGINWTAVGKVGRYAINFSTNNSLSSYANSPSTLTLGPSDAQAVIDALAQENLARILAEPNLTTMSGQAASFLVGGEYPVPVAQQNGSISVTFKQYGIGLSFVPTVLSDGRINLHVHPEVSSLTDQGAVQVSSDTSTFSIDALTVRSADTTIELGSGQSFAIAGLLQDTMNHAITKVPGLGELPVLGALFRSDSFQRNETELVIIVTPYIVRPTSDPSALHLPGEMMQAPDDLDRIALGHELAPGTPIVPFRMPGDAGFIVQ